LTKLHTTKAEQLWSMWYACDAVDVTTYHRGFHGDLNETLFVGAVSDKAKLLVQTTHECLARAIAAGTWSQFFMCICHSSWYSVFHVFVLYITVLWCLCSGWPLVWKTWKYHGIWQLSGILL